MLHCYCKFTSLDWFRTSIPNEFRNAIASQNPKNEQLKWTSKRKKSIVKTVRKGGHPMLVGSALSLRPLVSCQEVKLATWLQKLGGRYDWPFVTISDREVDAKKLLQFVTIRPFATIWSFVHCEKWPLTARRASAILP